jgi:hypothetical protein
MEKELTAAMERNRMPLFRALMGRRSCNSHLALTFGKSARIIEHDRQTISAWCREKIFNAPLLTTTLDVARRKPVCCCA